jgi:two-component system phosphate regulon sensor histidine kinase PhoR
MRIKRLVWRVYFSYLLLILGSITIISLFVSKELRRFSIQETKKNLAFRGYFIGNTCLELFKTQASSSAVVSSLQTFFEQIQKETSLYCVLFDTKGQELAGTDSFSSFQNPEIQEALSQDSGNDIRYHPHFQKEMISIALPLFHEGKRILILQLFMTIHSVYAPLEEFYLRILFGGSTLFLLIAFICWFFSNWLCQPLERLRQYAENIAQGKNSSPLLVPFHNIEEIEKLAQAMNQMASQLHERLHQMTQQKTTLEAILSSMIEGVIAIDQEDRILSLNQATIEMFQLQYPAQGQLLQEAIRNPHLHHFAQQIWQNPTSTQETAITLFSPQERYLKAHGTVLYETRNQKMGALIVLHDITKLHRLENIRRDFVSNVSHELRTPLTAIKGFVETLQDSNLAEEKETRSFLTIIARHVDRLNAIIEDLLTLAHLEHQKTGEIVRPSQSLLEVIEMALQICKKSAQEKEILLQLIPSPEYKIPLNATLLCQALVNLIDNAIKYSEAHSKVQIRIEKQEKKIKIQVIDQGCGIPQEHHPRIFERFYRVDKARSRKVGGTGLGLSIVKHIVLSHHGEIYLESQVGRGSIFTLTLPTEK